MSFHGQIDKFISSIGYVYYHSEYTQSDICCVLVDTQAGIEFLEDLREQTEALVNFIRWFDTDEVVYEQRQINIGL